MHKSFLSLLALAIGAFSTAIPRPDASPSGDQSYGSANSKIKRYPSEDQGYGSSNGKVKRDPPSRQPAVDIEESSLSAYYKLVKREPVYHQVYDQVYDEVKDQVYE